MLNDLKNERFVPLQITLIRQTKPEGANQSNNQQNWQRQSQKMKINLMGQRDKGTLLTYTQRTQLDTDAQYYVGAVKPKVLDKTENSLNNMKRTKYTKYNLGTRAGPRGLSTLKKLLKTTEQ